MKVKATSCCGLVELENISDASNPAEVLEFIRGNGGDYTFILYTGVTSYEEDLSKEELKEMGWAGKNYGQQLMDFIHKHKLGRVIRTNAALNEGSGNMIRTWVMEPNWDNIHAVDGFASLDKPIRLKIVKKPKKKTGPKAVLLRRDWIR